MRKTALGISDAALVCFAYLLALFGGYTPLVLVTGYVLLKEKNDWVRFSVVKAALLTMCFTVLNLVVYLLPNLISFINSICYIFEGSGIRSAAIGNIANALDSGLVLTEKVLFVLLAIKSITHKTLKIGIIDTLAEKIAFGTSTQAQQSAMAPAQVVPQPVQSQPQVPTQDPQ